MLRDMNLSVNGRRDSTDPRVGVLASEIQAGFPLESWLLNDVDPAFPNRLYSVEVLTLPSAGVLYLDKAGVGSFTGAPDGTYSGTQRVEKFDPGVGRISSADGPYTLTISTPASTVTGVTVSPSTATGSRTFAATVAGANSPSQAVTWAVNGGAIDSAGVFIAPARTSVAQVITVTATSVQDPSQSGTATVTIPALRTATITLASAAGVLATGLTGLKWAWFDQATPDLFTAPTDKGSAELTDGAAVITVDLPNTTKTSGQVGWLIVTNSDGTTAMVHKAFSGPVAVN